MKNSIRNRLITAFVCLAIVPLLLLGVVLPWQNFLVQKEQVKTLQQELTVQAAKNIFAYLHEQEHRLQALLKANYLPEMSADQQTSVLYKFLTAATVENYGYVFNEITLLDPGGKELVRISRLSPVSSGDLSDRAGAAEFIIPAGRGEDYYGPIYSDKLTGESMMTISMPIRDLLTMDISGVLIAEMRLGFMWNAVASLQIGETGIAFMVDSGGRVVVHPNPLVVLRNTQFSVPEKPSIIKGVEGVKAVVAAKKIDFGAQPLYFVTELPTAEAYRYLTRSLFIVVGFLLVTLAAAVVLGFVLVHQIVWPIESLAATVKQISDGDISKKVPVARMDEFGNLAAAFNTMTSRLADTIDALGKEKDFVNSAIESLSNPFYVIDARNYTVLLANSADNFGPLTPGSKCYMLTHKSDRPCRGPDHPCTIEQIKKTGKPVVFEHVHCQEEEGAKKIYEVCGYPIFDANGDVDQVIEYNIDITEKKSLEAQLLQSQKLEAVGSLAGGVAHDFNNLLSVIIGYSEMLLLRLPGDDPARNEIQEIQTAGEKASLLTRQLLAFSRKQVLEIKVINLNSVVERLAKMLGRIIGDNITLKLSKGAALRNIKADRGQMDQVLLNLAVNARDAMAEGGKLDIETCNVDLDEEYARIHEGVKPGPHVMMAVTDTGAGMSREVREKIFEPFYTTKRHGTGLGLATVYGVVKQHGGHIFVYSEPGMGSTFKVYFPATTEDEIDHPAAVEEVVELKGSETILVADDEPSIPDLVSDTLEPLGYRVLKALSGEEALALSDATEDAIDLLLTDVVMKGMNGRQLAEAISAKRPGLKVVYMSGYTENTIARGGVLGEDIIFIQKPVRPGMLSRKTREVLNSRSG